jgi:hypothetical protein
MNSDLINIKNFIVFEIGKVAVDKAFLQNLDNFLGNLIEEKENGLLKDNFQVKAGRQLLCCIGIDIKAQTVPLYHYYNIFINIDFSDNTKQARLRFMDSLRSTKLFYRESATRCNPEYTFMVCPIKDWKYYINPNIIGVVGYAQSDYVIAKIVNFTQTDDLILHSKNLDKKRELCYFWLTNRADVISFQTDDPSYSITSLVDRLGLSQLDFLDVNMKYFFSIDLGDVEFNTFKPNATIIDWGMPLVGFLSYSKDDVGRTFSISGYSNYYGGFKECVFEKVSLSDNGIKTTRVSAFEDSIIGSLKIERDEIIQEGVNRFLNI